ncbi:MAG: hypothetical protein JXQ75_04490 [Phycisphaerae bacterium]|nr:hypothetical protein [Phycisphaerae bacterium]
MHVTREKSAWVSRAVLAILAWVGCWGCSPTQQVKETAAEPTYTIVLDRTDNGCAVTSDQTDGDQIAVIPRALSFEMAGFSCPQVAGDAQEERGAAMQAAMIDAFCQALIEARRARGRSDSDFTAQLGPRLTVTHRTVDDGYQVEVGLVSRGVQTSFVVRNGVLQHPPRDLRLIHQVFEETNGEFSLLGTEWMPATNTCVAKVGCYLPAGLAEALAGDVDATMSGAAEAP